MRDQDMFAGDHLGPTLVYSSVGFAVGLAMLIALDLGKPLNDYVSLREVQSVVTMSVATAAITSFLVFSFTRLDFVPRSIPFLHLLVLASLMFVIRVVATRWREHRESRKAFDVVAPQYVLLVGANRLAWFYLQAVKSVGLGRTEIVAILDDDPSLFGRTMFGYQVLAPPSQLPRVVSEYKVHGVDISRVLIAANRPTDASQRWNGVEDYCRSLDMDVHFLGDMLGIEFDAPSLSDPPVETMAPSARAKFTLKRAFDFAASLAILGAFSPVLIVVAAGLLIDVGWPVTFWQKRDGRDGRPFFLYKFRTLYAPFDRHGRFVEEDQRTSRFGLLLGRTRLDELPQLWNVLIGDMSLVGPRPLLPIDQPATTRLRLQVLPGLTGWAQIHGGKLVSADEKGVLDDWYVEHMSFWLDIQIIWRTISIVFVGDKRFEAKPPSGGSHADRAVLDDKASSASAIGSRRADRLGPTDDEPAACLATRSRSVSPAASAATVAAAPVRRGLTLRLG
jgi:lipopolysaccharide/colanic/teichoic acid biosynthesis glycosyltransferase